MEFNSLHFMFIFYSFAVTVLGVNVLFVKKTPLIIIRLLTFGKVHKSFKKQSSIVSKCEIPKRWFSHFYIFASVYFFFITGAILLRYFGNVPSPFFVQLLNLLGSLKREETEYATIYISGRWLTVPHLIGVMLFLLASNLQLKTHKALASLRKTGEKITSTGHHLPALGFFEYISCPHYLAEILIYLSFCIILSGKSYSWCLICVWVVCNQLLSGLMNHQWYKKSFENYPVKRKAIIPFLF